MLLNQDVSHGLDVLVSIVWAVCSLVSTRVGVVMESSSTKPDSGVTVIATSLVVSKDTYSCSGMGSFATHVVEPFFITVGLQRGFRANQPLPRVPTQRRGTVFAVGDQ